MVKSTLVFLGLLFLYVRGRVNDTCDPNYERPSSNENGCFIPCFKGVCRIYSTGTFYCVCDPHAYGSNCMQTCCKDCGEFGRCVRNLTNVEVCECSSNYTGEFCETLV